MTRTWTETETVVKRILPYLRRRGYVPEEDLDFETAVKTPDRYAKGYVDILVTCGKAKPQFLIEAKRSSKTLTEKDAKQAVSYAVGLKVPFAIVTNGTDMRAYNTVTGQPILWNGRLTALVPTRDQLSDVLAALKTDKQAQDLDLSGDKSLPFRPGLALKQLNALFTRCHNAIRKIEKDEENAFADFSKLLFLKLLEEKADTSAFTLPYSYMLHELADKPDSESDQVKDAVQDMISKVKSKTPYGDVLDDPIHLTKPKTFHYIVRELARVCFYDSSLDSKGAAFEYFVRATLKGKKLGQYFTPRPLVEVMVRLVGRAKVVNSLLAGTPVKVLDPACGTGGFLVFLMRDSLQILRDRVTEKKITSKAHSEAAEKIMRKVFFGSDANEGVAAAAKMNMIVAGDGHTNIRAEDSLAVDAVNWKVASPDCDIILTNPPFGTSEADSLAPVDLATYPIRTTRGQHLFLQKMVLCALPEGDICTVIDEGVLNTDTGKELRKWLFEKCRVVAVVRLPEETFKPNKINVKASILLLKRYQTEDSDLLRDYPVTFCDLDSLGYAGSGERLRGFDFDRLASEVEEVVLDRKVGPSRSGYNWCAFDISAQEILRDPTCRLDLKYWMPRMRQQIAALRAGGGKTIKELSVTPASRGASPPSDAYVDESDGYAIVIKAGTNISKYGEVLLGGDYVEKNVYDEMASAHVADGDILLASTGEGTLGKCCVYRSKEPALADGHVTIIRVNASSILPEYLCDYLRAGFGARQIQRLFTGSTGLIELTPDHVNAIVVDTMADALAPQQKATAKLRVSEESYRKTLADAESALVQAEKEFSGLE